MRGFKFHLDEINYTVAGREIKFINADSGDKPAIAITRARKLIDHDKVHIIAGLFLTFNAYAVAPVTTEAKVPLVILAAGASDLTQRKRSYYVIRLGLAGMQVGFPLGDYAYRTLGARKAVTVAYDYGWGYECAGGFHAAFEDLGGKVIKKMWAPNDCMDFGPYVSGIPSEADVICSVISGASTVRFIRGLRNSGILDRVKVVGGGPIADENYLPALGDAALGVFTSFPVSGALPSPEYVAFKKRHLEKTGKEPTSFGSIAYTGAEWVIQAIKNINGEVEDREKFMKALRTVQMDSIRGPLSLDKYGNVLQNIYIREIEKVGGKYQNTVVSTYPHCSQFWTYDPEEFLKQPIYDREHPPCKWCK
jgi:branched-chain amino acid transport system substrate-binding protein